MTIKLSNEVTQALVKYLAKNAPKSFWVRHSYYGGTEYNRDFVYGLRNLYGAKPLYEENLRDEAKKILDEIVKNLDSVQEGEFEKEKESEFAGTGYDSDTVTVHYLNFKHNGKDYNFFFDEYSEQIENVKGYIRARQKEPVDFISLVEGC